MAPSAKYSPSKSDECIACPQDSPCVENIYKHVYCVLVEPVENFSTTITWSTLLIVLSTALVTTGLLAILNWLLKKRVFARIRRHVSWAWSDFMANLRDVLPSRFGGHSEFHSTSSVNFRINVINRSWIELEEFGENLPAPSGFNESGVQLLDMFSRVEENDLVTEMATELANELDNEMVGVPSDANSINSYYVDF